MATTVAMLLGLVLPDFGGDVLGYVQAAESECNTPCITNSAQTCGGPWRNSVYEIGSSTPTSAQGALQ